jgi:acetyl-CoA C-acetyltransferase
MMTKPVYIIDGARTPFLKAKSYPGPFSAADLAVAAGRDLLARQPFAPSELGEVIVGCVMPREDEANIARVVSLRLGCGNTVPAWTVQRNCGSGMQAIDSGMKDISLGRCDLVLAGGTEAMSRAPLLYNKDYVNWLSAWMAAKNPLEYAKLILKIRPHFLTPISALRKGLTDPVVGLSMGQTAEQLAHDFKISREQMDKFALNSHQRLIEAKQQHHLQEIVTLYDTQGHAYDADTGVRADTTLEKLSALKPFFDQFGSVTAGNSSQVSDGAAMLILASKEAIHRYDLPVLGRIVDVNWAALAPEIMGLGPVFAATPLLQRQQLQLKDIDYWEINEAFAAQVLACRAAWNDDTFCHDKLGLDAALGELDLDRLNVDGGAIALGHPVGASGARIVLHLLHILKRNKAKYGLALICIGGGQGGAMLLEHVESAELK